jgi:methylmalonyl-CoA mutase
VNTFLAKDAAAEEETTIELIRSTTGEKEAQIVSLEKFQTSHSVQSAEAMSKLQKVAREGGNIFEELLETVKSSSLGQISAGLYQVGGQYRRNM